MEPSVFVIDAQPIVGAIRQEAIQPIVERILADSVAGRIRLRLTAVNAGEVVYGVERALGAASSHRALSQVQHWTEIVTVDLELAARAGWIKVRGGMSYADCFAAALAHRDGIPVITGDPEFRRVEDLVEIAWLDSFGHISG